MDFTKMPEVDFSKYKSPITAKIEISDIPDAMNDTMTTFDKLAKELVDKQERYVYRQIMKVSDIQIDYDKLTRALAYDRGQYEAGYIAGYNAARDEIKRRIDNFVSSLRNGDEYDK